MPVVIVSVSEVNLNECFLGMYNVVVVVGLVCMLVNRHKILGGELHVK